jgi:hypothetical protein
MSKELEGRVSYACGQLVGTEEDIRFKGYFEFTSQSRVGPIREWLCADPAAEAAEAPVGRWAWGFEAVPVFLKDRDTHIASHTDESERYIGPDELIAGAAWVVGKSKRGGQGERNDMHEIKEVLREFGPQEGIRQVAERFPGAFMRYPSGIAQLADLVVPRVVEDPDFTLRPWQECLVTILKGPAHDRHIYWVEDAIGGEGKSRLSTFLCRKMNAVELDGRLTDAAFAYASQPIVIFDLARAVDLLQLKDLYTMAEKLKNGQVVSSKYHSKLKVFKPPHVVFFSNSPPPLGVWSADRVQHILLNSAPEFKARTQAKAPGGAPPVAMGAALFKQLLAKRAAEEAAAAQQADEDAEVREELQAGAEAAEANLAEIFRRAKRARDENEEEERAQE